MKAATTAATTAVTAAVTKAKPIGAGAVAREILVVGSSCDAIAGVNLLDGLCGATLAANVSIVLITDDDHLDSDLLKLAAMKARHVMPLMRGQEDLPGEVYEAIRSIRASSPPTAPSPSVLRAARACASSFPLDAMGELRPVIESMARLAAAPSEFIVGSMLATTAGLSNGRFEVQARQGFTVPTTLWTVLVGDPSTQKSPSMDLVLGPVRSRESSLRASARAAAAAASSVASAAAPVDAGAA